MEWTIEHEKNEDHALRWNIERGGSEDRSRRKIVSDEIPKSRIILALRGTLPAELVHVKNLLGVEVIENIKII